MGGRQGDGGFEHVDHFAFVGELKTYPDKEDFEPSGKDKSVMMKALVHAADIARARA